MMARILMLLAVLLTSSPTLAQAPTGTLPPPVPHAAVARPVPAPEVPRISAGHAAALGAGMFMGALAGSALINGGALAAVIGAAAGITIGHWYWTERVDAED
jgi:hypothetical protein